MQSQEDGAGDSLLVRWAIQSSARRILRTLVGDTRPELVRLASADTAAVLWIGDVLIRDAVPFSAVVVTIEDGVVTVRAIASDPARGDVTARLARGVVSACVHAEHRCIVLPAPEAVSAGDEEFAAFHQVVVYGRSVVPAEGPWTLDLMAI